MPEVRPDVDVEAIAVSYLAPLAEIIAITGANGVSTDLPRRWAPAPDGNPARLRITRIGGTSDGRDPTGYVDNARLQIDGFAAGSADASLLVRLAVAALLRLPTSGIVYPGAVVTAVRKDLRLQRRDDQTTNVESYFAGVILTAHPAAV